MAVTRSSKLSSGLTPDEHLRALSHFEERTRELGIDLAQSDLIAVFRGWVGLQSQLGRVRQYLAGEVLSADKGEKSTDGHR